ncbi:MAG: prepilin peptidase [Oscillospiraceae bacterium]|nr:prepilin peptidase [Oscillospiraceae bacterium]
MSIWQSRGMLVYFGCVAFALGAVFGSFLNCAAWRITHGESVMKGRSHCPQCGHVLSPRELIPIFSWLFQRGRCRSCGGKIPARYPLTELIFGLLTLLCLLRFDLTWLCLRNWVFLCCLFVLTLTDLDDYLIPDSCLIIAAVAWLIGALLMRTPWQEMLKSLLAGLLFGGGILGVSLLMDRLLQRDSLGGGDIKLFAVCGLYLGFIGTLFTVMLSCILGLAFAALRKRMNPDGKKEFPFGPSIAAAAALMLLYGEPLVTWYTSLF